MSLRTALRNAMANAALQACKATGVQVSYQNNGESAVTVWCAPLAENTTGQGFVGLDADAQEKAFAIPRQTGFPPTAGVQAKATVTHPVGSSGEVYSVERIVADSIEATYRLECKLRTPRRVGPNA